MASDVCFTFSEIEHGNPKVASAFCQRLHTAGHAVVCFDHDLATEVEELRNCAQEFFALPACEKHEVVADANGVGGEGIGYRDVPDHQSEFLETFLAADGGAHPPTLSSKHLGLSLSTARLHQRLTKAARTLLLVCAAHIRLPADAITDAIHMWTGADELDEGADVSSTLLRICHYRPACGEPSENPSPTVLFLPHTDSTLLTLSPLHSSSPGLQLQVDRGAWLDVEQSAPATSVCVHAGDFLASLSRGYYYAMRHRVVRPPNGAPRISCPLLVRPRDDWRRNRGWLKYTERDSTSSSSDDENDVEEEEHSGAQEPEEPKCGRVLEKPKA